MLLGDAVKHVADRLMAMGRDNPFGVHAMVSAVTRDRIAGTA